MSEIRAFCFSHFSNLREIFQSYLSAGFPPTPLTTTSSSQATGTTTSSGQPAMSSLASLLISADTEQETGSHSNVLGSLNEATPTTTSAGTTAPESGMITPEEISNITSSDAATVHSSASGRLLED